MTKIRFPKGTVKLGVSPNLGASKTYRIQLGSTGFCAKEDNSGTSISVGNSSNPGYRDFLTNAVIPEPIFVNPKIAYVGNGRFQNLFGAEKTFKGFVTCVPYVNNLINISVNFTVGLWDGANIVPDVAQEEIWVNLKSPNVANASGEYQRYEYEITVPANGIWGFGIERRNPNALNTNVVVRGFSHTVVAEA